MKSNHQLRNWKNNKTSGVDNVVNEFFKYAHTG